MVCQTERTHAAIGRSGAMELEMHDITENIKPLQKSILYAPREISLVAKPVTKHGCHIVPVYRVAAGSGGGNVMTGSVYSAARRRV